MATLAHHRSVNQGGDQPNNPSSMRDITPNCGFSMPRQIKMVISAGTV